MAEKTYGKGEDNEKTFGKNEDNMAKKRLVERDRTMRRLIAKENNEVEKTYLESEDKEKEENHVYDSVDYHFLQRDYQQHGCTYQYPVLTQQTPDILP